MGQPLCCSAADAGMWEREAMVMASPSMHDSAVSPCFHGCPGFPPQPFPTMISSHIPLNPSVHSQQHPSLWDHSTFPKLQLTATLPSRGLLSLSGVSMAVARTICFLLHLGCHRSAVSLSALNVSPLTQTIALMWGSDPC